MELFRLVAVEGRVALGKVPATGTGLKNIKAQKNKVPRLILSIASATMMLSFGPSTTSLRQRSLFQELAKHTDVFDGSNDRFWHAKDKIQPVSGNFYLSTLIFSPV